MDLNGLMQLNQLQNMWLSTQLLPGLMDTSLSGDRTSQITNLLGSGVDPYSIEKAAKLHRNAAGKIKL